MKLILVVDVTAQETMHFQMHPKSTFIEILNSELLQGESSLTLRIMIWKQLEEVQFLWYE